MSLSKKIAWSTIWQVGSKMLIALLGLFSVKILVSGLTVEQYGMYTTAYKFLDFFAILADFGLYTVIIREISKDPDKEEETFNHMFSLRMVLAFSVFVLASVTVYFFPQYRGTVIPFSVMLAGFSMLVTFFNGTLTAMLQRHWDMGITSIGVTIGKVIQVGLYAFLFWFVGAFGNKGSVSDSSFYALFLIGVISMIFTAFITYSRTNKYVNLRFTFNFQRWKKIIIETFPYGMAIFLATVYLKIDILMLSLMKGPYDVGLYGISAKLLEILMIFPQYFLNSLLPLFTLYLVTEQNREKFSSVMDKTFLVMALMAFPIVFGGIGLSYPLIVAIGDPEYLTTATQVGSDAALRVLLWVLPFTFFAQIFQYLLIAQKKHLSLLYINVFAVILNITLNFWLIPVYGFMGAAYTSVLSELFALGFSFYYFETDFKYNFPYSKVMGIFVISALLGWFVKYLYDPTFVIIGNLNIPILIALYAVLYGLLVLAFRIVKMGDLSRILKG